MGDDWQIQAFADAHNSAMRAGDLTLDPVEQKILHALVAKSVSDTYSWVRTRLPDGVRKSQLLADLSTELQKGDMVGKGIKVIEKDLGTQAKNAVGVWLAQASAPAWWSVAFAVGAGIIGFLIHVGSGAGQFFAFLMYLLVAVAALHLLVPPFRAWLLRTLGTVVPAMVGRGAQVAGFVVSNLFNYANETGKSAELLFTRQVQDSADALCGAGYTATESRKVITPVRVIAIGIFILTMAALVASIIFLIYGMDHGFTKQVQECQQVYPGSQDCGLTQ